MLLMRQPVTSVGIPRKCFLSFNKEKSCFIFVVDWSKTESGQEPIYRDAKIVHCANRKMHHHKALHRKAPHRECVCRMGGKQSDGATTGCGWVGTRADLGTRGCGWVGLRVKEQGLRNRRVEMCEGQMKQRKGSVLLCNNGL